MSLRIGILGGGPAGMIAALEVRKVFRNLADILIFDMAPKEKMRDPAIKHPFFVHEDVASQIGVPLKKIRVRESVSCMNPRSDWARLYSMATTGMLTENALTDFTSEVRVRDAWVSNSIVADLYDKAVESRAHIIDGVEIQSISRGGKAAVIHPSSGGGVAVDVIISTIPAPALIRILKASDLGITADQFMTENAVVACGDFSNNSLVNKCAEVVYDPSAHDNWIRFANIFGVVTIEYHRATTLQMVNRMFDGPHARVRIPEPYDSLLEASKFSISAHNGRFIPIDEQLRRAMIYRLTSKYSIFSLGRFATWSYKRVDHLPADAAAIVRMIDKKLQSGEYGNA